MDFSVVESFLIILLIALMVAVVCRHLKLPIILGYVLVGVVISPYAVAWLPDAKMMEGLAEFGVVLLMFTVGLEFSLSKLYALRHTVFVLGGLQVLISLLATMFIGIHVGMALEASLVMGSIVAMSSTAIVLKQLDDQFETNTQHGSNAVGILLFQDLAVIPILVFIASMGKVETQSFWFIIAWSLVKGIVAIVIILTIGQRLLRPLFRLIAATRVVELFTLNVLLVSVGAAWLTHALGLSYALGAFLAGIMLAECEYKSQIKTEIRPFRDILLGLFFISIGMLVDLRTWSQAWLWIVLLVAGLMVGKTVLVIALSRLFKDPWVVAVRTGLVLGQGGEFGFAILSLALIHQQLPSNWGQSVLAALLIAFIFSPIIIRYNASIANFLLPKQTKRLAAKAHSVIEDATESLHRHILLCGYGRVGQNIAGCLERVNLPYIGIDLDPDIIQNAKLAGDVVCYGDATHPDILEAAQLDKASAVIISFGETRSTISTLNHIRTKHPKLPVLARCSDEPEAKLLRQQGITHVVVETFEESLTLVHRLLHFLNVPHQDIIDLLKSVREKKDGMLARVFLGSFAGKDLLHEHLSVVPLPSQAYAIGHTLQQLNISSMGVDVISIRRGQKRHFKPRSNTKLLAGDILVLYGSSKDLKQAEYALLEG